MHRSGEKFTTSLVKNSPPLLTPCPRTEPAPPGNLARAAARGDRGPHERRVRRLWGFEGRRNQDLPARDGGAPDPALPRSRGGRRRCATGVVRGAAPAVRGRQDRHRRDDQPRAHGRSPLTDRAPHPRRSPRLPPSAGEPTPRFWPTRRRTCSPTVCRSAADPIDAVRPLRAMPSRTRRGRDRAGRTRMGPQKTRV